MKKVRFFETDAHRDEMESSDCHSPRPFIKALTLPKKVEKCYDFYPSPVVHLDPVMQQERSNSFPYSVANKTTLADDYCNPSKYLPSNDLDLSMLDAGQEPRRYPIGEILKPPVYSNIMSISNQETLLSQQPNSNNIPVLHPVENVVRPQTDPSKDNSFFIRRDNFHTLQVQDNYIVKKQGSNLLRENNAHYSKEKIMKNGISNPFSALMNKPDDSLTLSDDENCCCHHCRKQTKENILPHPLQHQGHTSKVPYSHKTIQSCPGALKQCQCMMACHLHYQHFSKQPCNHSSMANEHQCPVASTSHMPQNAVDKKTWAIEKFEQSKKNDCTDVEKPSAVAKAKREPTVADLFKIIKLQNEQLQLLQEKVDKFISTSKTNQHPLQNYVTERVVLQGVDNDPKISIGVMTSFEMVHTSTVINKEITTNNMAQVHCNRSQISVKEVAFRQPGSQNFLDGILPVGSTTVSDTAENLSDNHCNNPTWQCDIVGKPQAAQEEKTLNECSLYNVQVDNATTPLISPEQTMYLDVKDYSDSDSTSSDHSNVGWTYYNKVMTHVNNVLQESDLPSSASALFRNTRQKCVQMHIDKTNISVTKRVKFGDELQVLPQPQFQQLNHMATTDTSLKMNQLAAKYLKMAPQTQRAVVNAVAPNDISLATRRYMERHEILQGLPPPTPPLQHRDFGSPMGSPAIYDMPKFLDITALKQQPKLL